jgi:hypothetical protein
MPFYDAKALLMAVVKLGLVMSDKLIAWKCLAWQT